MKLRTISQKCFRVAAVEDHRGKCATTDFLKVDNPAVRGLRVLLERVATEGLARFSSTLAHHVGQEIYEFKKGDYRLLWFKGHGETVVICSHGFVKKSQKTPTSEVDAAAAWRKAYFDSK
ncbi:MAG: type II toxin-antitoxin system RelE/ParE family toxin [Methyloversatilis discipulorum]|uniref:type II toxin-antitoxin system RelE/ParE family toxin n=1 Tax=Methyloversatilis discipulorum TaxID=1119528 RepID=UPI0026F1AD86|nr:type II toxin-antitoxin system RelE/ParE family toxin [Methyloversatilis discipulorum]MBT9517933.1 type II toxin-antitoxin system RelE/ParE family toxin [Methyloversatilis discipulorum]